MHRQVFHSHLGCIIILAVFHFIWTDCRIHAQAETPDEDLATYQEILALDADTLQAHYYKQLGDVRYPVYILDQLLSTSSARPKMERFGEPVTFIRKDVAYLPDLKAYFRVDRYSCMDTTARIQLYYSHGELVMDASYRRTATGWEPIDLDLHLHDRVSEDSLLVYYEEVLRLALDEEVLLPCLSLQVDGVPLSVLIADSGFSCNTRQPSITKFGHPVAFVTLDRVDSVGSTANVLIAEFSYQPRTDDTRSAEIATIKLTNPADGNTFEGMYARALQTWHPSWVEGCSIPWTDSTRSIDTSGDEPAYEPFPPSPIDGLEKYGYVVTGWTEDVRMHTQLVRLPEDTTREDFTVLDSFTMRYTIQRCADDIVYFVAEDDSLFHFVTLGPLPYARRDTVVSCRKPDASYFSFTSCFFVLKDSLFAFQLHVSTGIPGENEQFFIGRVGEDGFADTVGLFVGAVGGYLSIDSTEVYFTVLSKPDHGNWPRRNIGIYDLVADSLLTPLDGDYHNWAPYRASRNEPMYFLRTTGARTTNIWRWHENSGEEQLTFHHHPEEVKYGQITGDSVIYYVGTYGVQSDSTNTERLAIPLEAGE